MSFRPVIAGMVSVSGAAASPIAAITSGTITGLTGFAIRDTSAAFDLTFGATSTTPLTAGRSVTWDVNNTSQTLKFTGASTVTFPSGTTTLAQLGANTFTALQTITQGTANTGILASTGYSLTGSDATSMIDIAGTWNTSGTPTAIKANITDTASNAASLLMDLQLNGASVFYFQKNGQFTGSVFRASNGVIGGTGVMANATALYVGANTHIAFTAHAIAEIANSDVILARDAANILALCNSTAAQTFRVYGTTSGSKYLNLTHDGTNAVISASSGNVHITSLPTSNPGAGILWNNAGTPAIGT